MKRIKTALWNLANSDELEEAQSLETYSASCWCGWKLQHQEYSSVEKAYGDHTTECLKKGENITHAAFWRDLAWETTSEEAIRIRSSG